MMAVVLDAFGPPSALSYRKVPVIAPGRDEVLVEVHAVSINRTLDLAVRAHGDGRRVTLPLVLGVDPSGIAVALGEEVDGVRLGERVAVLALRCRRCAGCRSGGACSARFQLGVEHWGGYAQYVTVPAWALVALPEGLGFAEASVLLRHYPIAHHLLSDLGGLVRGERALVLGAAGGLGSAGVQVAKALGAEVIAGAGADERVAAAIELGADHGVNYRTQDLEHEVLALTEGRGVDLCFENIADPTLWPGAFNSLGDNGRHVTAGSHGGGIVPLDVRRLYQRRLRILGGGGRTEADVAWVLAAAARGELSPLIATVLPLAEAALGHELVAAGELTGKVLLDPTLAV
jgi:NADPH:quinone reductase-like Zn-dependent oxidoreductase